MLNACRWLSGTPPTAAGGPRSKPARWALDRLDERELIAEALRALDDARTFLERAARERDGARR